MASEAATIGANFSNYTGDPNLGGSSLGAVRIDTRPIEDLARYTMLYNKAQYDQRQKDAEAAAKEIADYMAYDLTTSIAKDAKVLHDGYEKMINFYKQNPDAINYRNREKWAEGKKLRNEFENDLQGAKIRSVMNLSREKEIATETDEQLKKFRQQELDKEINATDIRTPIKYSQQFDISIPDFGKNAGIKVDVTKVGSNQIFQRDFNLFDVSEARRAGAAAELGFNAIDKATTTGQLKTIKANQNFWIKGSEVLNQAIQSTKKSDGTVDETKLIDLPIMKNINDYNRYIEQKREEIAKGLYVDKLGNKITFGAGPFRIEDYQPINWQDGITPSELAVVAQFSQWAGDEFQTKVIQTDDAIQRANLDAEWARIGLEKEKINKASTQAVLGADAVLNEVKDAIKLGVPRRYKEANGKWVEVLDIADPNLLKEFATIDKDGNMINRPDVIRYDKSKNQLSLVYLQKRTEDADNGSYKKGDIIQTGPAGVTSVDRTVPINPTEWFGQIAARKFSADDRGAINNFVDQIYNAFDRDLTKLADGYKGGATTAASDNKTTESIETTKIPEGTMAEWLATPGWTKERISEYKKKGLIKVK